MIVFWGTQHYWNSFRFTLTSATGSM